MAAIKAEAVPVMTEVVPMAKREATAPAKKEAAQVMREVVPMVVIWEAVVPDMEAA